MLGFIYIHLYFNAASTTDHALGLVIRGKCSFMQIGSNAVWGPISWSLWLLNTKVPAQED